MKKGLLGSTAIIGATVLMASAAFAAEPPTYKLTGNVNFQFYNIDQDLTNANTTEQSMFFGVDEAELQLNVSGTADNGLNYGFKIELNANKDDNAAADEVRLQLSGGWGTVQMGNEDGASDIMAYGGETIMGATGGYDGDLGDMILTAGGEAQDVGPNLTGDTGDATKISYFSPRFSGFQVGASYTPNSDDTGDTSGTDGSWVDIIEVGANYDNSFGGVRVRASAVYLTDSNGDAPDAQDDASAWAVGGIVGFGPASVAASYGDSGESHDANGNEASYWNVAASFETGPLYFSAGYELNTQETTGGVDEDEWELISLTADYTVAPGLGVYAEINLFDDSDGSAPADDNDGTIIILGANVSF